MDVEAYHAHQQILAMESPQVVIPFAEELAQACKPVSLRLRRDFKNVLALIKTHALLHAHLRQRDEENRIVAILEDYAVVYELVADILNDSADEAVPEDVRRTVETVSELHARDGKAPNIKEVARSLGVHHSTASRRVSKAVSLGFLKKSAKADRQEATLTLGRPLPDEEEGRVLPTPEELESL